VSGVLWLRIAGVVQLGLAAAHLFFPKHLRWNVELPRLGLLNRQIFFVHTAFICLVLTMIGGVSVLAPQALLEPSRLGGLVRGGIAFFWFCRLCAQWLLFDAKLWRGHAVRTAIHLGLTALWLFLTLVYALSPVDL
jgi:hypothetical protein